MDVGVSTKARLLESICSLQPLRIPRPQCTGMEWVPTRGRQGYYLSTRRRDYGNNGQPKRPPLAGLFESIPKTLETIKDKEKEQASAEEAKSDGSCTPQSDTVIDSDANKSEQSVAGKNSVDKLQTGLEQSTT